MIGSLLAVVVGGSIGCLLRWFLALQLNSLFPSLPPGTWLANMIGAYIIGLALAFFAGNPSISPEWKLLLTTGFCGGLTTFSTFSAEIVLQLQAGRYVTAGVAVLAHVVGSLLLTGLGFWSYQLLRSRHGVA